MQAFIDTANHFGRFRQPFFFLIDFEKRKPQIMPLEQAKRNGLLFDFGGTRNFENSVFSPEKAFEFHFLPIDFSTYQQGFEWVQKNIQAGNSYLLNLSYPTKIHTNYRLDDIFFASSAKYKMLLLDEFVCFSPECFVRIQNDHIYSYPMKGTINATIENARQKLLGSEKELSEHNTIVDLIRNDLALVSKNIRVSKYRYLEKIETNRGAIYQTSSEICGQLSESWREEIGTILAKLLPAGSISGAPKLKTVEIIQEAEKLSRGYYTGVFGYFDGKSLESAVAIRYIENRDGQYYFRSGGGITHLSELDDEYHEILEKVYVPISSF